MPFSRSVFFGLVYFPLFSILLFLFPINLLAHDFPFDSIKSEIASYFPKIEGYVVEVKDGDVIIDLGSKTGIKKGIEFLCIREGEEFTHPITGTVLGRFEDKLGIVKIVGIFENYSIGNVIERFSQQVIKRGDKLRISSARIPSAIISTNNSSLTELFRQKLEQTGRFLFISEASVREAFQELNLSDFDGLSSEQIKMLGEKLNISLLILIKEIGFDTKGGLEVQMVSTDTGTNIAKLNYETGIIEVADIDDKAYQTKVEPGKSTEQGFWTAPISEIVNTSNLSEIMDFSIQYFAIGDFTGGKKKELCITDGQNIRICKIDKGKLKQISYFKGSISDHHISLNIADINRNGKDEIFISNLDNGSLRSFVLECDGNNILTIWDNVPFYISVMKVYPDEMVLLGEYRGINKPFDDRVFKYEWKNNEYAKAEDIKLPPNVNIFNLVKADIDLDGEVETIHLDNKLRIYRDNKLIWQSETEYGGKSDFFEFRSTGPISTEEEKKQVNLSSHFIVKDFNSNHIPELLLIKNISSTARLFPRSRFYRKGEACIIEWNGISFNEIWCSGKIEAYLTDIGISDIDNDGKNELLISMILSEGIGKFWKKDKSRILIY